MFGLCGYITMNYVKCAPDPFKTQLIVLICVVVIVIVVVAVAVVYLLILSPLSSTSGIPHRGFFI
jgi:flagellar basal body-associated protein FliL